MKNTTKIHKPKISEKIKYTVEYHHTCSNSAICKIKIHPDETCKKCIHYKYRKTQVAKDTVRHDLLNMF